jgi:tungstate transport system substrate-binding protein
MMRFAAAIIYALGVAACTGGETGRERVVLAATHTLEDSGLLDAIVVEFEAAHPQYALQATVSSSGQALEMARQGDVDVLLTHSPEDERTFMDEGYGAARREVMQSEFVLVGPAADSAHVRRVRDIGDAFRRIAEARQPFISRGDASGTHRKEQSIWQDIGITPSGDWYLEAGVGMADALRLAAQRSAYILSERATWMTAGAGLPLEILSEGDARLVNIYSVITVRLAGNARGATAFYEWISGPDGQAAIAAFGAAQADSPLFAPLRFDVRDS